VIALASVSPLVVLTVVFIFFCRRGRAGRFWVFSAFVSGWL
jgi:hypothetical protein